MGRAETVPWAAPTTGTAPNARDGDPDPVLAPGRLARALDEQG